MLIIEEQGRPSVDNKIDIIAVTFILPKALPLESTS